MITAKKTVKFDRSYAIGEEVPLEVIDPAAKKRLIDMGLIEDSPGYYMDYDPIRSVPEEEKPVELERLEAQAAEAELPYSIDELKKLKKDQLKEVAASFAVENFEQMKVDELIAAIYAAETDGL